MKLILVLGTSLSAASLAAGFAMFANQALSRESNIISERPRAIMPSRVTPTIDPRLMSLAGTHGAALTPEKPIRARTVAAAPVIAPADPEPVTPVAVHTPDLAPLFAATSSLAERPPRRPVSIALGPMAWDTVSPDTAVVSANRIPASNFENLPLIGVYR